MNRRPVLPGFEGIPHVSIRATDWEASVRFYGELLGLARTAEARFPDGRQIVRFADTAGYEIELVSRGAEAAAVDGPIAHIGLAVADVEQAIRVIESEGFPVTRPPTDIDIDGLRATIAFFTGPNGESLELIRAIAPRDDR
jgi:catechol 2,3-dioxygenase-like lactoylglutathione lyase family enzyme